MKLVQKMKYTIVVIPQFHFFILVHHESKLAAKVAEKKIWTLTSQVTKRDEEIRLLKEELHKKTKGIKH